MFWFMEFTLKGISFPTFLSGLLPLAGSLGFGAKAGAERRWGTWELLWRSPFSNAALSWLTVGLTASLGSTEAAAEGTVAGVGAGGSSSLSRASVDPLKRATTSRRLPWKPDARSFFNKMRFVAACFSWQRQSINWGWLDVMKTPHNNNHLPVEFVVQRSS